MKRYLLGTMAMLLVLLCVLGVASASTLTLPDSLTSIESEAFYGTKSLDEVKLPLGLERIESKAFANSTVKTITMFERISYIADNAFSGSKLSTVRCLTGSYAYNWAVRNGYQVSALDPIISTMTATNGTVIEIEWGGADTATGFSIEYSTDSSFKGSTIAHTGIVKNYTLGGLSPSTEYFIRIYAWYGEFDCMTGSHSITTGKITNQVSIERISIRGQSGDDIYWLGYGTIGEETSTVKNSITIDPINATNYKLKWTSSDKNVATVDQNTGIITPLTIGVTKITAVATDGSSKSIGGNFFVLPKGPTGVKASVNGNTITVTWDAAKYAEAYDVMLYAEDIDDSVYVNGIAKTRKCVIEHLAPNTNYEVWVSSGVDFGEDLGMIYGGSNGYISVMTGPSSAPIPVREMQWDEWEVEIEAGQTYNAAENLTILPSYASNKKVTWSSDNVAVAKVNKSTGLVTAVGGGYATITATAADGSAVARNFSVHVNSPTNIELYPETVQIYPGETYPLYVSYDPIDTYADITWTSSNASVAAVEDGIVTAIATGKTTITASTSYGLKASCQIEVLTETLKIDNSTAAKWNLYNGLTANKTFTLNVTKDVQASSDVDWLNTYIYSGKLVVVAEQFDSTVAKERVGVVTLTNDRTIATLTVTQASIMDAPVVTSPSLSTNSYYPTEMTLREFDLVIQKGNSGSHPVYMVYQQNSSGSYDLLSGRTHNTTTTKMSVSPTAYDYKLVEGNTYRFDVLEMTESFRKSNSYILNQTIKNSYYVKFIPVPVPDYPRNVSVVSSKEGFDISWDAVEYAEGYYVHYNNSVETVTGQRANQCTITADKLVRGRLYTIWVSAYNDSGNSDTNGVIKRNERWTYTVPPEKITITDYTNKMRIGTTESFTWLLEPEDVDIDDVYFESSDEDVAVAFGDGTVLALGYGKAKISVISAVDESVSASFNVKVEPMTVSKPTFYSSYPKVVSENEVDLKWKSSTTLGDEAIKYYIYTSYSKDDGYGVLCSWPANKEYENVCKPGVTYWYKIRACATDPRTGKTVWSEFSDPKSATTPGTPYSVVSVSSDAGNSDDPNSLGIFKPGQSISLTFNMQNTKRIWARFQSGATTSSNALTTASGATWMLNSTSVTGDTYVWNTTVPSNLSNGRYYLYVVASPYSDADTSSDSTLDQTRKDSQFIPFTINSGYKPDDDDPDEVASVSITAPNTMLAEEVSASSNNVFVAAIAPDSAADAKVTWKSSNTNVLKPIPQSQSSTLQFSTGSVSVPTSVTLTASAGDCQDSINVTVYDRPDIKVNGTSVNVRTTHDLTKGDLTIAWTTGRSTSDHMVATAIYTVEPNLSDDGTGVQEGRLGGNYNSYYTSGNTSFTIPASELVKGQYIKIAVRSYGCAWRIISVYITDSSMQSVSISGSKSITMTVGDKAKTLTASYLPTNASNNALLWKSSDESVVSVKGNGKSATITALKAGNAKVTVYNSTNQTVEDYATVVVTEPIIEYTIDEIVKNVQTPIGGEIVSTGEQVYYTGQKISYIVDVLNNVDIDIEAEVKIINSSGTQTMTVHGGKVNTNQYKVEIQAEKSGYYTVIMYGKMNGNKQLISTEKRYIVIVKANGKIYRNTSSAYVLFDSPMASTTNSTSVEYGYPLFLQGVYDSNWVYVEYRGISQEDGIVRGFVKSSDTIGYEPNSIIGTKRAYILSSADIWVNYKDDLFNEEKINKTGGLTSQVDAAEKSVDNMFKVFTIGGVPTSNITTDYSTTVKSLDKYLDEMIALAKPNDTTYIFILAHGLENSAIKVGKEPFEYTGKFGEFGEDVAWLLDYAFNKSEVKIKDLVNKISNISGRVIIFFESCHGGNLIIEASKKMLSSQQYTIFTAVTHDKNATFGFFTQRLLRACTRYSNNISYLDADKNEDGVISYRELKYYTNHVVKEGDYWPDFRGVDSTIIFTY